MARSYTKLLVTIVNDRDFLDCSLNAKFLYLMICAMPKLSPAGCVEYRPAKWARLDKSWTVESVETSVAELVQGRYIRLDEGTEEVWVRSFIKIDGGFNNRNIAKSILSAVNMIESPELRRAARWEFDHAAMKDQAEGSEQHRTEDREQDRSDGVGDGHADLTATTTPPSNVQAATDTVAAASDFDLAVDAALNVRRAQTTITDEDRWAPAARTGIINDYGATIRRYIDNGMPAVNAGRVALGAEPLNIPRAPVVDSSHGRECECGGSMWVPVDDANDRRGGAVKRCEAVQPEATVHSWCVVSVSPSMTSPTTWRVVDGQIVGPPTASWDDRMEGTITECGDIYDKWCQMMADQGES